MSGHRSAAERSFPLSLLDDWALIRSSDPLLVLGAAFVGFTLVIGLIGHLVNVHACGVRPKESCPDSRRRQNVGPLARYS